MLVIVDPEYAALGSNIDIVCFSDEANPTATIEWSLNEVAPETSDITENACCNAEIRRSKITIPNVQRSNNGQEITCSVPGTLVSAVATLSVACKCNMNVVTETYALKLEKMSYGVML